MYLYIDRENIIALAQSHKNALYNDCIKAIKKQLNVFFNFSKKELKTDDTLMNWFRLLTEGIDTTNNFTFLDEYIFPSRPIKENCISEFTANKLCAIYLLNDENINSLKVTGAVLVGSPGEEIQVFNRLFLLQNDYDFHKDIAIGGPELTSWNDLAKYAMPITDIVFIDSFILVDASLIPSNLIPYLELLCSNARTAVNIILYVDFECINVDLTTLKNQIKASIELITGHKPTFTLIRYRSRRGVDHLGEHDRTIFTNYVRIKSGDTYNYFLSDGSKYTTGRELTYNSLAKKESHNLAKKLIQDLQANIDFLKTNGESITGDKVSNFLNF